MAKQQIMTESSFQNLKAELDYLINVKRKEASERVGIARSYGDLAENSEYDEARNEQAKVEAEIAKLEETIANAKVISDSEIQTDVVNIGVIVTLYDLDLEDEVAYSIVSSRDVDALNNKISDQCPVGKKLVGSKVGDTVTVEIPDGIARYKVLNIEKATVKRSENN